MKKKTRVIGILALALVLLLAACALVGNYFYNFALSRNDGDSAGNAAPGESPQAGEGPGAEEVFGKDAAWLEEVGCEERYMESYDGLRLHAYSIPAPDTKRYAVICHGYHSRADSMFKFAEKFYAMGYGVLLPDARGHGESEGHYVGMGWHERLDILDWADMLIAQEPDCEIVLFGVSMGGATVMMVSGEEVPPNVKAIVEDCGYSSIWEEFSYQLGEMFGLPSFPVLHLASLTAQIRAGYGFFREGDAAAQVAKSKTPILFIHGGEDTFVPTGMVYTVYEAAQCEKELLVIEGAAHAMASAVDPELYWGTVEAFLQAHTGAES